MNKGLLAGAGAIVVALLLIAGLGGIINHPPGPKPGPTATPAPCATCVTPMPKPTFTATPKPKPSFTATFVPPIPTIPPVVTVKPTIKPVPTAVQTIPIPVPSAQPTK